MRNDTASPLGTEPTNRSVVLVAYDGMAVFEFGIACEIFGGNWCEDLRVPSWYDFSIYAASPSVTFDVGPRIETPSVPGALRDAGTVIVPPTDYSDRVPDQILEGLRAAHERGARLVSLCTGALVLAEAGVLDGRRVTTHWAECDVLAAKCPDIQVDPGVLYVDDGDILTSAGSAAGIDLCIHVVRQDHGADVAARLARQLVTPPHRDGGQQQFITAPLADADDGGRLAGVIAWARVNLDRQLPLDELAARALMSRRSFVRHFKAATGATPHAWLLSQRLSLAQELLETTSLPVEQIAERAGYRSAAVFREQFAARRGLAPRDYRRTFSRAT